MVAGNLPRLVIFDLCDTLYDTNTTIGFVRHYHSLQGSQKDDHVVRRWLSRRSPWFYIGAIAHRLFGRDVARERIIATLAGKSKAKLTAAARDYARNILPSRANAPLQERLASHREAGDRVMLLSSSLDIVVAEIATLLGVDFRASELGFDAEICTGKLKQDLTGSKAVAVRDLMDSGLELCVYTDNRSDKDLLAIADRASIVIPRGSPDVRWGGDRCEYIRL
jgi:phosphoserine phosphatase